MLADVGLLGMPNAGKSTLIRSVSAARPKVADYPFTTLTPNLGVVRVSGHQSFVIADIPGLIEGAAEGAGLGIQFLKHLERCGLLLHVVDVAPFDDSHPAESAVMILEELKRYSPKLFDKPRWLVLNKTDLLDDEQLAEQKQKVIAALNWEGPVYELSALTGKACDGLMREIMTYLETLPKEVLEEEQTPDEPVEFKWSTYHQNKVAEVEEQEDFDDDDDFDDDEPDDGHVVFQR